MVKDCTVILEDIKNQIKQIKPYKVIVFGSAITEKFHKDSDIDLLVSYFTSYYMKSSTKSWLEFANHDLIAAQKLMEDEYLVKNIKLWKRS